jgi:hypothetical protein
MSKKKAPTPAPKRKVTKLSKSTNVKAKAKTNKKKPPVDLTPDKKTGKIPMPLNVPDFVKMNVAAFNKTAKKPK